MNKLVQKINSKTEKVKQTKFKKTMFCKLQTYSNKDLQKSINLC